MNFSGDPNNEDEMSRYDVDVADKWSPLSDLCIRIEEMIKSPSDLILVEELSAELKELVGKL